MGRRRLALAALCGLSLLAVGKTAQAGIDAATAGRYLDEARSIGRRDDGRLWGVALDGPLLFVDPATRELVANRPDAAGLLARDGAVYRGRWPAERPVANMAVDWAGERWTMVQWPLPDDASSRGILLAHEMFHRVQDALGLPAASPANAHLDSASGRYWMQLEWRALATALRTEGERRRHAVRDALAFQARRRALVPQAGAEERALEMNEGLAEYTGCAAAPADADARRLAALRNLAAGPAKPSFTRSFAYVSGPAYGLLLDEAGARWRPGLAPESDLGQLLAKALDVELPREIAPAADAAASAYDAPALLAAETAREQEKKARVTAYRARFVEGPILVLPLTSVQVSFDPNALVPVEGLGTVYPTLQAADSWGTLDVAKGALVSSDWKTLVVPAPRHLDDRPLTGDGWTLSLAPGWTIGPGERPGDCRLQRASSTTE